MTEGLLSCLTVCLTTSMVAGQAPILPEPRQVDPQHRIERKYQGSYSESHSRELFRACDNNSDDRLDVFETTTAFDLLTSPSDHKGYARFDVDRNGFVSWPEFDQRFQKRLRNGGTFRVRTSRPFVMPEPPPQPLTPLERFHRLYDSDGDGGLSPSEITDLLRRLGLPETIGRLLAQSDHNKSGKIDVAEIAPWFEALPTPAITDSPDNAGGLQQPWLDADANEDQAIDESEFTVLLRRLDPGLLRWTKALMDSLDTNHDGKLSSSELQPQKPNDARSKTKSSTSKVKTQPPQR